MKKFFLLPAALCSGIFFFSCSNGNDNGKSFTDSFRKADSIKKAAAAKPDSSTPQNSMEEKPEVFHLSPKDSARVADSVQKTKNQIRDFN